ncbi:hypothetical protein [Paucilactobacillus nenjiangensis]|uniref:hypothetical protein n=1 Tax=Paucilactobacillus nenjiangensis TaxID=1296540 RepID=UPI0028D1039F|nr:hypothetical protein [Paucilactobacillus nenjiangensis]
MRELSINTRVRINWMLEVIAISMLVAIFIVWLSNPAKLATPSVNHEGWFVSYIWLGTTAVTMVSFNALKNGLGMLPRITPIKEDRDYTPEEYHFTVFSLVSLLVIPALAFPVMMSLHYVLSDVNSLVSFTQLAIN